MFSVMEHVYEFIAIVHGVWFLAFFVAAWRAGALGGANFFAAAIAGPCAALCMLLFLLLLYQIPLLPPVIKAFRSSCDSFWWLMSLKAGCVVFFLPLFALLRRLFKRRGFGRDYWLVVGLMPSLTPLMYGIVIAVGVSFHGNC